uniref:CobQ/CobB/MinD/ParA nucleotide binding domain-containing protein n=1 Tax=Pseudomonas marincola TaxID=437900 RepID=A0A653DXL8_9PSED
MSIRKCPALLVAAPASGQGKTTVTAALARLYSRAGKRVRVFKCGPDFLDPMILARASGQPVYQLDLWMVGEAESRRLLWEAAGEADLILIEGVMGLFDGNPSAADLARHFGVPVMAVIDASAMAQTFAALAHGLATYQADLPFSGFWPIVWAVPVTARFCATLCQHQFAGTAACRAVPALSCRVGIWAWFRPMS